MAPACHALHGWATRVVHLNIEFRFRDCNPIPSTRAWHGNQGQ